MANNIHRHGNVIEEKAQMPKTYFTLGQAHQHTLPLPEGDKVWDKDGVVAVEADSENIAIDFIILMFGYKWASSYTELTEHLYFKGVIHTYIIPPGTTL